MPFMSYQSSVEDAVEAAKQRIASLKKAK